jgi:hypothetical protein
MSKLRRYTKAGSKWPGVSVAEAVETEIVAVEQRAGRAEASADDIRDKSVSTVVQPYCTGAHYFKALSLAERAVIAVVMLAVADAGARGAGAYTRSHVSST